jgi:hypothetical protein
MLTQATATATATATAVDNGWTLMQLRIAKALR